jgi:hypothetical protein
MRLPVQSYRACDIAGRVARILALSFFWYVSSYILMMDWGCQAYDPTAATFTAESHYHMTHSVRVRGDFSIYAPERCWANWVFRPLDRFLHFLFVATGDRKFPSEQGMVPEGGGHQTIPGPCVGAHAESLPAGSPSWAYGTIKICAG